MCMWFRVGGMSFSLLSDEEADSAEARWVQILNAVESGIVVARTQPFVWGGRTYARRVFFLSCREEPPSTLEVAPSEPPARAWVVEERADHVVLSDGRLARCVMFTRFPDRLLEGFLHEYSLVAEESVIVFRALDQARAASIVDKLRRSYEGLSMDSRASSRILQKHQKLESLAFTIGSANRLFEFYTYLILTARSKGELDDLLRAVRKHARSRLCEVDVPKFFQRPLYEYSTTVMKGFVGVKPLYAPSESLRAWFPFVSEDLLDEGGVFLGYSSTNAPVFFNPFARNNYNMVVLGETGSGKSLTAKMLISKLRAEKGLRVLGLDPEDEYVAVADRLGVKPRRIQRGEELGLDPFRLLHERLLSVDEVADILAAFYLPQGDQVLQNQLRRACSDLADSESIENFVKSLEAYNKEVFEYVAPSLIEPDRAVFEGDPLDASGDYVFGTRELGAATVAGARYKALTTTLLTVYLQKQIFGDYNPGLFFVDEAWQYLSYPVTMEVLESVARKARKYNKAFLFITQKPADVASNPSGRTILEQSATSILLRQRQAAIPLLKEIYRLREEEAEALVNAETGQGVMRSGQYLIKLTVTPTEEELKAFSTSGQWVRGG